MLLLLALLSADAAEEALAWEVTRVVEHGVTAPILTLKPLTKGKVAADISCDGQRWSHEGALVPDATIHIPLTEIAEGEHDCRADLDVKTAKGAASRLSLAFHVSSLSEMAITAAADDVDLANKTLVLHATRPVKRGFAQVLTFHGAEADGAGADVSDPLNPRFSWTSDAEVVQLVILAEDDKGFRAEMRINPWKVVLPAEIPFDGSALGSGADAVLTTARTEALAAAKKWAAQAPARLWLSVRAADVATATARAAAVGSWFRGHGYDGEIRVRREAGPDQTSMVVAADPPAVGPWAPH